MKVLYDNFEVHYCAEYEFEGERYCEQIEEDAPQSEHEINRFWTVYGHLPVGGIEAIADFQNKVFADELCSFLNSLLDKANIGKENR